MSNAIKCIVRQGWTTRDADGNLIERRDYVYVTNEDGTPYIYASIAEARADIRGNYGRDANRAGILHTRSVDDYTGHVHDGYVYIVREDTDEFAAATADAKAEQAAAAEVIAAATAAALQAAEKAEQAKAETLAAREAGDEFAAAKHAQEAATYAQAASRASGDAYRANGNRVNATAHEADKRANEAASIAIRVYYETREDLAAAEAAAPAAFDEYANCEDLVNAIAYDAFEATRYYGARPETAEELEQLDRLMGYATKIVKRDGPAYGIEWEPYQVCEFEAEQAAFEARNAAIVNADKAAKELESLAVCLEDGDAEEAETCANWCATAAESAEDAARIAAEHARKAGTEAAQEAAETAAEHAKKARELSNIARDATRPTYQRAELLAYLGEPDDYDVTAIEHDATAYDPATGRTVWTVDAETLAAIAERHQLQFYAPAF